MLLQGRHRIGHAPLSAAVQRVEGEIADPLTDQDSEQLADETGPDEAGVHDGQQGGRVDDHGQEQARPRGATDAGSLVGKKSTSSVSRPWTKGDLGVAYQVFRGPIREYGEPAETALITATLTGAHHYASTGPSTVDLSDSPTLWVKVAFLADVMDAHCPPGALRPLIASSHVAFEPDSYNRTPVEELEPNDHVDFAPGYVPAKFLSLHFPEMENLHPSSNGTIHITLELSVGKENVQLVDSFRVKAGPSFGTRPLPTDT